MRLSRFRVRERSEEGGNALPSRRYGFKTSEPENTNCCLFVIDKQATTRMPSRICALPINVSFNMHIYKCMSMWPLYMHIFVFVVIRTHICTTG